MSRTDESRMEKAMIHRECMRNHAATLGMYATDGCGEYIQDPSTPGRHRCAACGCHRNFHRKVPATTSGAMEGHGLVLAYSPSSASAEDRTPEGKKKARTRFSTEQKERMVQFAESIGWRIPKRHGGGGGGDEVARFCRQIGVSRQVFKVWMHNHKRSNPSCSSSPSTAPGDTIATTLTTTTTTTTVTTTDADASSPTQQLF